MKHVISCEQFSRETLIKLFERTDDIRQNPSKYKDAISDKLIATLFYEPSTRTRLSFEAAIQRLGGKVLSTENAREMSSAIKGESLPDTIRVVQGYCDAIVMRHHENKAALRAANISQVPIINAGDGSGEHPTQALLDMYTIYKKKGTIDGISVVVLGDLLFGRTIHSLIKLLALYDNVTIYGFNRDGLALPDYYVTYLQERGIKYIKCNSFDQIPKDVDVLYHTRTQTERIINSDLSVEEIIIDKEVLDRFSECSILLHPLPRNREISTDVDDDKRAVFFEQSKNGMYVRMALIYGILCE